VDELVENLQQEQSKLARVIEDPCTSDESILAQVENVIAAHEPLLQRVGEHITTLRSKLPAGQRERLMQLCAEVLRGPMRQGRGRGSGGGQAYGPTGFLRSRPGAVRARLWPRGRVEGGTDGAAGRQTD